MVADGDLGGGYSRSKRDGTTTWCGDVSDQWMAEVCRSVSQSTKRRFVMDGPDASAGAQAFVKIQRRRPGHGVIHRLKKSRAVLEGLGYLAFARAEIAIPKLLAWGERRRFGLFELGFVVTERIEALDVSVVLEEDPDTAVIRGVAETIAKIHRAGLVHGDPLLRNFLVRNRGSRSPWSRRGGPQGGSSPARDEIVALDLGGFGSVSKETRRTDLIRFLGSVLFHTNDPDRAGRALHHYASLGEPLPDRVDDLLAEAVIYGQRKEAKEAARAVRREARRTAAREKAVDAAAADPAKGRSR